ncbi:MAG TPA: cation diffusion facilitator family transporter [Bacillota bacterium]|nr:cation diffusion facilitator family transporter [Bacillota bacterium]
MKDFLIRHFVTDYENTKDPKVREDYGKLAGIVGIFSNLILCGFKIGTGLVFNSISIVADGINNLSDASASLVTLIGFRMSGKKADAEHPYGHGRIEYLTGLMISVMILVIGVQLLRSSIEKTMNPEALRFSWITVAVLVIAIAVKFWQTRFNMSVGNTIDSATLKATGTDSRNDVLATTAVLLAIGLEKLSGYPLDGPVGILVALFILYSGWMLINETVSPLLGKAPDPETVRALKEQIEAYDGVIATHDLILHDYGPGRVFGSVHVEVDASVDIQESHDMVDNIEREVYKYMGVLLTIHMDPMDLSDPLTLKVRQQLDEICARTEEILEIHDVRVVSGITHHNVIFDVMIPRSCKKTEAFLRERITEELQSYDPKYRTVITVDRSYE